MANFVYPTSSQLETINQNYLPVLQGNNPWFRMFPEKKIPKARLEWEQKDNYIGLQAVRGLNGAPSRVNRVGIKAYAMTPGVYGEFIELNEQEITTRRAMGSYNEAIDLTDLVREGQDQLLTRRVMRQKKLIVDLVVYGYFSVLSPTGALLHADGYTQRTFAATVPWGTPATSTPLADFRAVQLMKRGYSVTFGAQATAWMNQTTLNQMLANTNTGDVGGKRLDNGQTVNSIDGIAMLLSANGLPKIGVWDEGYYDDTNTFNLDIPNGYIVVEGKRADNASIGNFGLTLNANNPNAEPGAYMKVIDRMEMTVPRTVEVHDGFNGGPIIYYPSALVVMRV